MLTKVIDRTIKTGLPLAFLFGAAISIQGYFNKDQKTIIIGLFFIIPFIVVIIGAWRIRKKKARNKKNNISKNILLTTQ